MSQRPSLPRWTARGREILSADDPTPKVMGIINLTPDSFSDGGSTQHPEAALAQAQRFAAEGAGLLDLGGESSRPGAKPVSLAEELSRVIPIVEAIAGQMTIPLSIDTTTAEVAQRAIRAGAVIINDITALRGDSTITRIAADSGAGVVLMHMQNTPATMQLNPRYDDVVTRIPTSGNAVWWAGSQWNSSRADRG